MANPTLASTIIFHAKAGLLRVARALRDLRDPVPRHDRAVERLKVVAAEIRTPLWVEEESAELAYQLGKVHNLRAAAQQLNGLLIPGGAVFSFWRQVGRASKRRGFARGRMLQQGCLLPSIGGGLCQLTNALYPSALDSGCEIVERHAHSRAVPGGPAAGRDATVAWNYVDLRFRPRRDLQIEVKLTADELIVRLRTQAEGTLIVMPSESDSRASANSCFTCHQDTCVHHARAAELPGVTKTAWLLDENWPEFRKWTGESALSRDVLFVPLNGARWKIGRYRWPVERFGAVREALWPALRRSWQARNLAEQGAERQKALLAGAEAVALSYARRLTPEMTHLVVAQSLLPFLWRDGHLGGRTFTVLMTRFPMSELQRRLDAAFQDHPEREALADFRASADLVRDENEALRAADRVVTPHVAIAGMFADRAVVLPWVLPSIERAPDGVHGAIGFPGAAVPRRGIDEVRVVAGEMGLRVVSGLKGVDAVVLPAVIEHQPRALLAAIAAGVPVIATRACGIPAQPGVTLINSPEELAGALERLRVPCELYSS